MTDTCMATATGVIHRIPTGTELRKRTRTECKRSLEPFMIWSSNDPSDTIADKRTLCERCFTRAERGV